VSENCSFLFGRLYLFYLVSEYRAKNVDSHDLRVVTLFKGSGDKLSPQVWIAGKDCANGGWPSEHQKEV